MATRYAEKTKVSASATQMQIQKLVQSYGGQEFTVSLRDDHALLGFRLGGRALRLTLPLPDRQERRFTRTSRYPYDRAPAAAAKLWEQACRANWRALLLVVKAKLEAIALGIMEIDEAFFADVMTETGATIYQAKRHELLPPLPAPAKLSLPEKKG